MLHLIEQAVELGALVYGSVSGGKDGQAMVRTMVNNRIPIAGLLHCDLGKVEWPQSLPMCRRQAAEYGLELHVLRNRNGLDLLQYIQRRRALVGPGEVFWPSSKARFCTSDYKRGPSNNFFRSLGQGLIISAEGIRAEESKARAKKKPLVVRPGVTSAYYTYIAGKNKKGKPIRKFYSVEECLAMYRPEKRLVLTWYPIFNMVEEEVWRTYGISRIILNAYRTHYRVNKTVHPTWPFHPAYVFGNKRVSCVFCVLGCENDLRIGAEHHPELLQEYVREEQESGITFKSNLALSSLV